MRYASFFFGGGALGRADLARFTRLAQVGKLGGLQLASSANYAFLAH